MELFGSDLVTLIKTVGILGLYAIVFAESGLLVGFFLPGDSLLFTAGFLASQGYLNIILVMLGCWAAAILGDSFGYTFGRRVGGRLFTREDSLFFHRKHLERAERFYRAHGGATIILARFMPVVRTFAPILAGVGKMHYPTFLFYNVIGGTIWAIGLSGLGYFLGSVIPDVDRYIIPLIFAIVVLSSMPILYHALRDREIRRAISAFLVSSLWRRRK